MQAVDRPLPPLYRAWERMVYFRNVHYWVGAEPPKDLNIPRPYYAPDKEAVEHAIFWYTGAYMWIISQDRAGSANGKTLDALYGDEAKLLDKAKFDNEIAKDQGGTFGSSPTILATAVRSLLPICQLHRNPNGYSSIILTTILTSKRMASGLR
jgi:hypothetical protein